MVYLRKACFAEMVVVVDIKIERFFSFSSRIVILLCIMLFLSYLAWSLDRRSLLPTDHVAGTTRRLPSSIARFRLTTTVRCVCVCIMAVSYVRCHFLSV